MDKLSIAANQYGKSIFEVLENIDHVDIRINKSTRTKLDNFVNMIKSFTILSENSDAFTVADTVSRKTGLLQELKKDGTPEGIARIENIEELLNGIKDFVDEQQENEETNGRLQEFMEDVALATDLDKENDDEDRVSLMTIHLAKGLEFPYVYIVGLEEDLFPSAMSINTRSELEEERRLFYVALTRAEKQAYLTYAQSRYRWGKITDADPSRFLEEINENFVDRMTPKDDGRYNPMLNADIFGEVDKSKLRQTKPKSGTPPPSHKPSEEQLRKLRRLRPGDKEVKRSKTQGVDLEKGQEVAHGRFGKGTVVGIEGAGRDKKAEINFEKGGIKKLLLRFAKLDKLS
jgi:DNA helicase-2/ATP-dependent DNA helicase PcrA